MFLGFLLGFFNNSLLLGDRCCAFFPQKKKKNQAFLALIISACFLLQLPSASLGWVPSSVSIMKQTAMIRSTSLFTVQNMILEDDDRSCIENARMAAGVPGILRCANTDKLATKVDNHQDSSLSPVERAIYQKTGLILDLRSPTERNETQANTWMMNAGFEAIALALEDVDTTSHSEESKLRALLQKHPRLVLRLDIFSPSKFMDYLEQNWLSGPDKMKASLFKVMDGGKLHELRMQTINERGLLGLNEAILETGKDGICTALKATTMHWEERLQSISTTKNGKEKDNNIDYLVVIHCVQGKDRTGLLTMLCQALVGVPDDIIVEDYYKSHYHKERKRQRTGNSNSISNQTDEETSAAMERATSQSTSASTTSSARPSKHNNEQSTKLDRSIFHSAPREVMEETLRYLRSEYGSIVPGYLNRIGFGESWQQRFQTAINAVGALEEQEEMATSRSRL